MPTTAQDDDVVMATYNVELNGRGDPAIREEVDRRIHEAGVHVLFRQEVSDGILDRKAVMYESEARTGLRGWLGEAPMSPNPYPSLQRTALFIDTATFRPLNEWENQWQGHRLPPTALTVQLREAGPDSAPIVLVAAHLHYGPPALREIEAGLLSTYNNKAIKVPTGRTRRSVMVCGLDGNSYPHNPGPGEPPLPDPAAITDEPHLANRSRLRADGSRAMDQDPHMILHTAGVHDIAAHLARTRPAADKRYLHPTVRGSATQGPPSRIDWLLASRQLMPAVTDLRVIDTGDASDHRLVIARFSRSHLAKLLSNPYLMAA